MSSAGETRVAFYGVRGSTPCSSERLRRYGGNTSCVVVDHDGQPPLILDMGTGLREFGAVHGNDLPIEATLLVSHLHWDHVQGLPFFAPIHHPDTSVRIYGPPHGDDDLRTTFNGMMQPPYFPICCDHLPPGIEFVGMWDESIVMGDAKVTARPVPHVGATNGYRVEVGGTVIAYVPDHQQPIDDPMSVAASVLDLCADADLLIHDAQFTPAELQARPHWGHCTPRYALEVAAQSGAGTLAMFHHDPWHDDEAVDQLLAECAVEAATLGIDVLAASEGLVVRLPAPQR